MNVFLVTSDDYDFGYGSQIYTYGIFDSKEQADRLVEELNNDKFNFRYAKVTAVTLNQNTCSYLGGYIE